MLQTVQVTTASDYDLSCTKDILQGEARLLLKSNEVCFGEC
jgi:hypothetical protein